MDTIQQDVIHVNKDGEWPTPHGDNPPDEWLETPHPEVSPETPFIVDNFGRVSSISHEWRRGHSSPSFRGFKPPRSPSGNKAFHQGETVTASGRHVKTGVVSYGNGHYANKDRWMRQSFYGDPSRVKIAGRCVETPDYAVICGYIVPGTTKSEVAQMRRCTISGEWEVVDGKVDYVGPVFVDRGGLKKGTDSVFTDVEVDEKFAQIADRYNLVTASNGRLLITAASYGRFNAMNEEIEETQEGTQSAKVLAEAVADNANRISELADELAIVREMVSEGVGEPPVIE